MGMIDPVNKNRIEELPFEKEKQIIQIQHSDWIIKYHIKDKRYSFYIKKANSRFPFEKT